MSALLLAVRAHPVLSVATLLILGPLAVFALFWIYSKPRWSDARARTEELPGDNLLLPDDTFIRLQEEVLIDAPIEDVWPWVAQLGARKGGFYALAWLERACIFHIYNTFEHVDAWQEVKEGDFLFYHQAGIGSQITGVEPGRWFTSLSDTRRPPTYQGAMALLPPFGLTHFAWTWNFVLLPTEDGRTRFVNRCDTTWAPYDRFWPRWLVIGLLGSPSVFMVRIMLDTIKRLSEKGPRPLTRRPRPAPVRHPRRRPGGPLSRAGARPPRGRLSGKVISSERATTLRLRVGS